MSVIVPDAGFPSAIVRGIRSPPSSTRTMTKFPAFRFRAMNGALISNLVMVGASTLFSTIRNICPLTLNDNGADKGIAHSCAIDVPEDYQKKLQF
jgi:hypothetical protein